MSPQLVTIGLTAFNAEGSIECAVASALAQDWRPIEIVVVDDASGDRTPEILGRLAKAHSEIRLFLQAENGGVAIARNRIIAEARGEFIAFFDDDDESDPGRVTAQLRRLTEYERDFARGAPVTCHTARRQIMPDGDVRIEATMGQLENRAAPHGPAVARRVLAGAPLEDAYGSCAGCSQLARTETFRALGGFDPFFRRNQDTEFCVRLARAGGHFPGIAAPLVTQTLTKTSDKSLDRLLGYKLALIDKHRDLFETEALFRFSRAWIELKHDWLSGNHRRFAARLAMATLAHPWLTCRRIRYALPNLEANRAFAQFHRHDDQ